MKDGLIAARSMGELRRAAAEGRAYYSCERFEDPYGRLVVGIGARLEGRALRTVAWMGRKSVQVSSVALHDRGWYRESLGGFEDDADAIPEGVDGLFQVVAKMHPGAARRLMKMNPKPRDLAHGMQVGTYVRRLMVAYNAIQREERFRYSPRDRMSGFVAGLVHDIGRWDGCPEEGHADRGAHLLRNLVVGSAWVCGLSNIVSHHHMKLGELGDRDVEAFRYLPLVLAEAVMEFAGGPVPAVYRLVAEHIPEFAKEFLISLCNLEHCAPPFTIVRIQNCEHPWKYDLAVSLQTESGGSFEPYLLRFAQCDTRGRPRPISLEYRCLIGPKHPEYEGRERVVVDLLSEAVYERLFKDYEGLIPVYQRMMGLKTQLLTL